MIRHDFHKIRRLPPYVFAEVDTLKVAARARGEDVVDLGMGNPDLPTPPHIVEKICETARVPRTHRYSASAGLPKLRAAICEWYARRHGVDLDPESEAVALLGSKEGFAHFVLMTMGPGDVALCPDPSYPIHHYAVTIAGGDLRGVPMEPDTGLLERLEAALATTWPRPKLLILSFPHNPTTKVVDLDFMVRVVELARANDLMLLHDFAYAEICFDGYRAPSVLEVPGAREVAIEFTTLSKSHSMAGWRVGFAAGNRDMIYSLRRIKSYLDYGIPTPIQVGAITALRGPQDCVEEIARSYSERRDVLIDGLGAPGPGAWEIPKPQATMFVWAQIPAPWRSAGSLEFSKRLLHEAKVAVSPGIGFGSQGDAYVRFALVENRQRIRQAVRSIRRFLRQGEERA